MELTPDGTPICDVHRRPMTVLFRTAVCDDCSPPLGGEAKPPTWRLSNRGSFTAREHDEETCSSCGYAAIPTIHLCDSRFGACVYVFFVDYAQDLLHLQIFWPDGSKSKIIAESASPWAQPAAVDAIQLLMHRKNFTLTVPEITDLVGSVADIFDWKDW